MNQIKESFDHLPIAACFFDANGVARLLNHRMLALAGVLVEGGVQTLIELQHALSNPPQGICCENNKLHIFRFPNGKAFRFSQTCITTKTGVTYTQVIATDVTEIMWHQAQLEEENVKLAQTNDRLQKLFEHMPELIREEEMLEMKQCVHNDIGYSILAARRAYYQHSELAHLKETAVLFEQTIGMLYRSSQMRSEGGLLMGKQSVGKQSAGEQSAGVRPVGVQSTEAQSVRARNSAAFADKLHAIDSAKDKAAEMGVVVQTEGHAPRTQKNGALAALAIGECAANCARHAYGTQVYVRFKQHGMLDTFTITNNGTAPQKEIQEGGGLSLLRHRIENAGGTMYIQSIPRFELCVALPQREALAHNIMLQNVGLPQREALPQREMLSQNETLLQGTISKEKA